LAAVVAAETFGRDDQLATLREQLGGALPAAVLIEGDAGIGKTRLLRAAVEHCRDGGFRILESAPAEAEASLAFGALADLAGALAEELADVVPPPRWRALATAVGLVDDGRAVPEGTSVALGLIATLRAAAERSPVLIAIDDVQWLDGSSATVLGFALRRLREDDRVALVLTRRSNTEARAQLDLRGSTLAERMSTMEVGPLSIGALHRLIRVRLGRPIGRRQLLEIHEASRGNPLHALELARAQEDGVSSPVPLTQAIRRRIDRLPGPARDAVLIAAAAPRPTVELLVELLGEAVAKEAVRAAAEAEILVDVDGRLEFGHPLFASRAYESAAPEERRHVHERLAAVAQSSEERARHLALSCDGADAALAAILEEEAAAAELRGTRTAAAELAEEAVRLTPSSDAGARARRLLSAGAARSDAGDPERAREHLERVVAMDGPARDRALWHLGMLLDVTEGPTSESIAFYEEALGTSDDALRSEILQRLAVSTAYIDVPRAVEQADAAVVAAERGGEPRLLAGALVTKSLTATLAGDPEALAWLARSLEVSPNDPEIRSSWTPEVLAADIARTTFDLDAARDSYERVLRRGMADGDASIELWAWRGLCLTEILAGRAARAREHANEARDLTEQTGLRLGAVLRTLGVFHAHVGELPEARSTLADCLTWARGNEELLIEVLAVSALGTLELSLGDWATAADTLDEAHALAASLGLAGTGYRLFEIDRAEALAMTGKATEAAEAAAEFEAVAAHEKVLWAAPLALRGRGLAAAARGEVERAVSLLERAVADEQLVPLPLERARTRLVLGRVLRRTKRRAAAREMLESAFELFESLEARLWSDQAKAELGRVGGRRSSGDELTATERRIAELVAGGQTNREVAAALYIAVHSVETNLTRIYRKLGVRSRTELANLLSAQIPEADLKE
jgi:DNA-binding CsgD family transcriptional regulator